MAIIHRFPFPAAPELPRALEQSISPQGSALPVPLPAAPVPSPVSEPARAYAPPRARAGAALADDAEREAAYRADMLAKIHIAKDWCKSHLEHYTDESYERTLENLYDVGSAADLSHVQLHDLLLHFAGLGWQKRRRRDKYRPDAADADTSGLSREALLAKIGAQLKASGREWGYAVGILKRQSGGVTRSFDQADRGQLRGVIAALWRDAKRKKRRTR